jgi:sugar phosphate isomerase/epimerase
VAAQVAAVARLGFRTIELNQDIDIFFPHSYNLPAIERLHLLQEELNLTYTVHLPLWSLEPSAPVEAIRQSSVDVLVDAALRLAPLQPDVFVLHATGALASEFSRMKALQGVEPLVLQLFVVQAQRSIAEFLSRTGLKPRQVAVETIDFPFDLTLGLARDFDLSVCLDVGHVLAGYTSGTSLFDALRQIGSRLAEVHLHDAYCRMAGGQTQAADHLALGKGDVPTADLLDRLAEQGFEGPLIFELTAEEALESLRVIRTLRPTYAPKDAPLQLSI